MVTKPVPVTAENYTFRVLNGLMDTMFAPEARRLAARLDDIVNQQEEVKPSGGKLCFRYGGAVYRHSRAAVLPNAPSLEWSLNGLMDQYLADVSRTGEDRGLISQTLFKCVHGWKDVQDFRNRLPESVVPLLSDGVQQLQRTVSFEEATCLKDRDQRQFLKILPKIEMYSTVRLIY